MEFLESESTNCDDYDESMPCPGMEHIKKEFVDMNDFLLHKNMFIDTGIETMSAFASFHVSKNTSSTTSLFSQCSYPELSSSNLCGPLESVNGESYLMRMDDMKGEGFDVQRAVSNGTLYSTDRSGSSTPPESPYCLMPMHFIASKTILSSAKCGTASVSESEVELNGMSIAVAPELNPFASIHALRDQIHEVVHRFCCFTPSGGASSTTTTESNEVESLSEEKGAYEASWDYVEQEFTWKIAIEHKQQVDDNADGGNGDAAVDGSILSVPLKPLSPYSPRASNTCRLNIHIYCGKDYMRQQEDQGAEAPQPLKHESERCDGECYIVELHRTCGRCQLISRLFESLKAQLGE